MLHRFASLGLKSRINARIASVLTLWLHRFASLGLKSRIDARISLKCAPLLQRLPSLGLKSGIAARIALVLTSLLHRFASLGLKSRIDAAPGSRTAAVPWRVPYAAAGECRMGRDFGRRSRPWLREREGPAAQRREGKHRRCAPVRSPCPQAESDAGALSRS